MSADERSPLLSFRKRRPDPSEVTRQDEALSILELQLPKDEEALGESSVGERLPYENYTSVDLLHDLVKDSYRYRGIHYRRGPKARLFALFDSLSGWIVVAVTGALTACVAFVVDVCEATVSDWKLGYCTRNPFLSKEACCDGITSSVSQECSTFIHWSQNYWKQFGIFTGFALAFGLLSAMVTLLTKRQLPDALSNTDTGQSEAEQTGKVMYLAAGSGIPEIKTVLSGFVIPDLLSLRVLLVKAVGAVFAVASGMCLGKEGPFVHISGCVGSLVANLSPKFRNNGRKFREILSASVASGLSVAFGAPIGGVLFAYEEISYTFPRQVLWRAFLCSLVAAVVLKALNPAGTGKLVLFETNYGTTYAPQHYLVFIFLGVCGGVWGGFFCKLNFKWSKWFRSFPVVKRYPVLEVFIVVLATALVQYPNPIVRDSGDLVIRKLLVDCKNGTAGNDSFLCHGESIGLNPPLIVWLIYGCLAKLVLTIITFGSKVPSGIIIPALDAGALFGRLIGQAMTDISPGILAMVGAGAFLAGVSRMTISLCVIMFELTGEIEYVVPHMTAILVAKWVADYLSVDSVYDLAQNVLGHPFLDMNQSISLVRKQRSSHLVGKLIPPKSTMQDITVCLDGYNQVSRSVLEQKLHKLKERGLMDAGLVIIGTNGLVRGYLAQAELDYGLNKLGSKCARNCSVLLLEEEANTSLPRYSPTGNAVSQAGTLDAELDLTSLVDRTPLSLSEAAPMEYAVELFGKLGIRYLIVTNDRTSLLAGVIIKKRMVKYLDDLHHGIDL